MDLLALADFHLVATHRGFGRASRASGQSKASLSRHVRELEESLGVRLIERGKRTLRLTDEGVVLHERTGSQIGEIKEALQDVKAGLGRPSGRLRISVPLLFAQTSLGSLAAAFLEAYPDVLLDVVADDRFIDLVADEIDAVVRVNPRPDSDLVGRCFLRNRLVLVAPPALSRPGLAPDGQIESIPAVLRHGAAEDEAWRVIDEQDGRERVFYPRAVMRLASPLSVRDAALAGAGAALIPRTIAVDALASGRLVSWGLSNQAPTEIWVLHASQRLASPKVRAFVDFVCHHFQDDGRQDPLTRD
ncbi:LysR family transcriptional regulator [Paucibacter sp. R3-3]|uniref:LysR family transcriptional regulator n=1 Tax=Roseateles agri TaxID=3098619 RepID=A0ABU5DPE5_9BURK|nr:LysR family transcriptional regulator [Paucibacter sp. R3-3]MDY0748190.1 LysR family transcriptional regulator [Paucibacter sp. R3-3]